MCGEMADEDCLRVPYLRQGWLNSMRNALGLGVAPGMKGLPALDWPLDSQAVSSPHR